MKHVISVATVALILAPLVSVASDDRASALAEKRLWAYSEKIALALPGDGRDVSTLVSSSASVTEIGPSLSAVNTVVVMGKRGRADSISFDLKGSCVPLKSLRSRYPSLLVLDHARGESVHARYTFGTQIGHSIIAYSFPAKTLGCMNHVAVSLAAPIQEKTGTR